MNKIYTFGDGFATGHIWPEWPQILQAIAPEYRVVNTSLLGAGNEFIFSNCLEYYRKDPNSTFIVQWAMPNRFDKLLQDTSWDQVIKTDPNYYDNTDYFNNHEWWSSSASENKLIKDYHDIYIQQEQANLRSFNYIWTLGSIINNHCFFGTYDFNYLTDEQKTQCKNFNWAWFMPWFGQERYAISQEFVTLRNQTSIQPHPIVHFKWLKKFVLPKLNLQIDQKRLDILAQELYNYNWIAYNPNNTYYWKEINNKL